MNDTSDMTACLRRAVCFWARCTCQGFLIPLYVLATYILSL